MPRLTPTPLSERPPGGRATVGPSRTTSRARSPTGSTSPTRWSLALSEADAALGVLSGLGRLIEDPEVLLGPLLTREALASSKIEGTNATLSEVLRAEATLGGPRPSDDVAEGRALPGRDAPGHRADRGPAVHPAPDPGAPRHPHDGRVRGGEEPWRAAPAHRCGSVQPGRPPGRRDVRYRPCPSTCSTCWRTGEWFVNEPSPIPVLVRCALMHYQFETIHPFLDGNGRIGRLLVGLLLLSEGRLSRPLLYLSGYLEAHRDEYYARLQGVRERGDVTGVPAVLPARGGAPVRGRGGAREQPGHPARAALRPVAPGPLPGLGTRPADLHHSLPQRAPRRASAGGDDAGRPQPPGPRGELRLVGAAGHRGGAVARRCGWPTTCCR